MNPRTRAVFTLVQAGLPMWDAQEAIDRSCLFGNDGLCYAHHEIVDEYIKIQVATYKEKQDEIQNLIEIPEE